MPGRYLCICIPVFDVFDIVKTSHVPGIGYQVPEFHPTATIATCYNCVLGITYNAITIVARCNFVAVINITGMHTTTICRIQLYLPMKEVLSV